MTTVHSASYFIRELSYIMRRLLKNKIYSNFKELFPINYEDNKLCGLLKIGQSILRKKIDKVNGPRILDKKDKNTRDIIREFAI